MDRATGIHITSGSEVLAFSIPSNGKWWSMLHFSCDLCSKDMVLGSSARYVVKMEVYAAHDPTEMTEDDFDVDHLEEIGQILTDESPDAEPAPAFKKIRYDLCPSCHKRFLADPLGRELQKFDFSEN